MRTILNINKDWMFLKNTAQVPASLEGAQRVDLPHTWNASDGQDGGNDYFRGTCCYVKTISTEQLPPADRYYLEIRGANSSADVYVDGKHLAHHDGGYSTWRVDITDHLSDGQIAVLVDNAPNDRVYPQTADFTFYGGLYRDVNIIAVSNTHFDLDYFGGTGIQVVPTVDGSNANVEVRTYTSNLQPGDLISCRILDGSGMPVAQQTSARSTADFVIFNAHLWNARKDPYLYTAEAIILRGSEVIDRVTARFGCRSFRIDPARGFILNGEEYPLRGVSRHQDRLGIGNALLPEHHREDMDLICEVGATTIRLAHYQHDQYFYDLCDERGMVVWAEIPYISNHMASGRDNTISQMKELVVQNYNHPSIVVWGLSNEITMGGAKDPDLLENHHILNDLVHDMDRTRLTTMAVLSMCSMDEEYVRIPDTVSYNHYFGWYGGDTTMNGPWFDRFHGKYPNIPIGCSEYGCEALNWHTSKPTQGDYTEEYQAYYHEELIRQLFTRKYLWATHVWNMFDFGADARAEGGENGQNHKGLVTMDRKYKKDAFFAYKAWLSDEPFVHICGKRYVDRVEDMTKITVYSNQPEVELYVNGEKLAKKRAADHFFYFDVPNAGETVITAVAGELKDESHIRKVEVFNEAYRLKEQGAVLKWFDITEKEGYFNLNDKLGDIMATVGGKVWFGALLLKLKAKMDAGKKPRRKSAMKDEKKGAGFSLNIDSVKGMMDMMGGFTVLRLAGMVGMVNVNFTREELLKMNRQLNMIKKPKNK